MVPLQDCNFTIFRILVLLRDQRMIERLSEAMSAALVGRRRGEIHWHHDRRNFISLA